MPFKDGEIYQRKPPHIIGYVSSETRDPDGLMLCTEYLGFESYDMMMSDKEVENKMKYHADQEATEMVERTRRKTKENLVVREVNREFPPLLSSLNCRGQRSFDLRPVRKDGRLELTKVMIDRQETFHASREDGRLRLHLVDAYYDSQETMDFEDESDNLESFSNENEGGNISISDREINEDNEDASDHQVVDSHEVSLNSDDDVEYFHDVDDAREWENKSCYKIVARRNHEENDYHGHHHHYYHHIHTYHHHNSNGNMHLWNQTLKTR